MKLIDKRLSREIIGLMYKMSLLMLSRPLTAVTLLNLIYHQYRFRRIRQSNTESNLLIPTFIIYSITKSCNLNCKGCYARIHQTSSGQELSSSEVDNILQQCEELGIGLFLIAGGEPYTREDVVSLFNKYKRTLFVVFTNGLMLNPDKIKEMGRNQIPVISLEGGQLQTNERRGESVYSALKLRFHDLYKSGRCWGASITTTSENIAEVLSDEFVTKLIRHNCRLVFYVEYVPIMAGTDNLILSEHQKKQLVEKTELMQKKLPALFIAFPGNEDLWDGCLAAGRGFVHIQADGSLEPCSFAPFSDVTLKETPLRIALKSNLLATIREKHHLLHESKGGCALWENKEFVQELVNKAD